MIVNLKLRTTTTTKVDGSARRAEQAAKKRQRSLRSIKPVDRP